MRRWREPSRASRRLREMARVEQGSENGGGRARSEDARPAPGAGGGQDGATGGSAQRDEKTISPKPP